MAKAQGAGSVATATGGVDNKATVEGDNSSATATDGDNNTACVNGDNSVATGGFGIVVPPSMSGGTVAIGSGGVPQGKSSLGFGATSRVARYCNLARPRRGTT